MKSILITVVLILSYTGYGSEVNETTTTTFEYVKPKKRKNKHRRKRKCYNSTILVGNGKYKKRRR